MRTIFILAFLMVITLTSCEKKDQTDTLPHQTVTFAVGPDFEISMPGALPGPIKMIALNGDFLPVDRSSEVALLLTHKGSDYFDTLVVRSGFRIENLDCDYFRFLNGENVLKGKIILRNNMTWRSCLSDEVTFQGTLSIIYQPN